MRRGTVFSCLVVKFFLRALEKLHAYRSRQCTGLATPPRWSVGGNSVDQACCECGKRDSDGSPHDCPQKTHRSRTAARCNQQGERPRKIDPPRAPKHVAPLVGAATACGCQSSIFAQMVDDPSSHPDISGPRRHRKRNVSASSESSRSRSVGKHHERGGTRTSASRDLEELACGLRRLCGPSSGQGAI